MTEYFDHHRYAGIIPALITPMTPENAIDYSTLEAHIERMVAAKVQALSPLGTTGESATLVSQERVEVLKLCLALAQRSGTPVIAGTGSYSTAEAINQTRVADTLGVDAVLVVAPYYNKPSQEGLVAHFCQVAQATERPVIVYNVPTRTVVDVSVETLARIVESCPNVIGVKDAAGHDLARVAEVRTKLGSDFVQLSGDDATFPGFLAMGGRGAISVVANVAPELMVRLQDAWNQADTETFVRLGQACVLLQRALFCDSSPAPTKYILATQKRAHPTVRLPLLELSENKKRIAENFVQQALALAN